MAIFIFIMLTVLFSFTALVYFAKSIRSIFEGYFMDSLVSFAITVGLIIIAFHFGSLIMKQYQNPNVQKEIDEYIKMIIDNLNIKDINIRNNIIHTLYKLKELLPLAADKKL